jgi:prepilin-type N-terminal cleavage/methylation domain-containing protein
MNRSDRNARGFTLIELLVVVAIIALLISILLPAMNGARAQSKQVYCLANMNALGKAAQLYAQANKDYLVQGDPVLAADIQRYGTDVHYLASMLPGLGYGEYVHGLFNRPGNGTFAEALHKVCRQIKLLQCPSFLNEKIDGTNRPPSAMGDQSLAYVVNAFAIPRRLDNVTISPTTGPGPVGAPVTTVRSIFFNKSKTGRADVSRIIYLTEGHERQPYPSSDDVPWDNGAGWSELTDIFIPNHMPFAAVPRIANDMRHPRGITATMMDGHAEVILPNKIDPGPQNGVNNIYDRCRRFTYDEREPM